MDKRLEKALDFSNFRMILSTRQENLKLLMNNKLMMTYEGSLFKVDLTLVSFIHALVVGGTEEFVFIDSNDIPILIKNLREFGIASFERYKSAVNQYYKSYQKLSEAREIRKVIDWNEEKEEK